MRYTTVYLAIAGASSVSATGFNIAHAARAPAPTAFAAVANLVEDPAGAAAAPLARRDEIACASTITAILPRLTDVPVPDDKLLEYFAENPPQTTNPCVDPVVTGTLSSDWAAYQSKYTSWRSAHLGDLRSAYQACSDVPRAMSSLSLDGICSTLLAEVTSQPTKPTGAAPRETGMVMAAVAAAGFVVAAM